MPITVKSVVTGESKVMHQGTPREALLLAYAQSNGDLPMSPADLETKYGRRVTQTGDAIICGEWQVPYEGQAGLELTVPRSVLLGNTPVDGLRQLEHEKVLLGFVRFAGIQLHIIFIEVSREVEGIEGSVGVLGPVHDPENRWAVMIESEPEGPFRTFDVPGFPGKYVFYLTSGAT